MFHVAQPPGAHPALVGWLAQRALELWRRSAADAGDRGRRPRSAIASRGARRSSANSRPAWSPTSATPPSCAPCCPRRSSDAETVFRQVTWHGYATGTYTDPVALDALLAAIPGRVVLLEGHAVGRSEAGRVDWDWETESREHREWIRAQENEYLERTGLAEVIRRHHATYLNVTEEFWDGRCARPRGIEPDGEFPELAGFVPAAARRARRRAADQLRALQGADPAEPVKSFWADPRAVAGRVGMGRIFTHVAHVCCALAKLYGSFLDLYGLVESINGAVRWDRRGLYRSRWGNYDLLPAPGVATLSRGVAGADVLAARLQGQDPARSAFYDVVRTELGISEPAEQLPLPEEWLVRPLADASGSLVARDHGPGREPCAELSSRRYPLLGLYLVRGAVGGLVETVEFLHDVLQPCFLIRGAEVDALLQRGLRALDGDAQVGQLAQRRQDLVAVHPADHLAELVERLADFLVLGGGGVGAGGDLVDEVGRLFDELLRRRLRHLGAFDAGEAAFEGFGALGELRAGGAVARFGLLRGLVGGELRGLLGAGSGCNVVAERARRASPVRRFRPAGRRVAVLGS